MKSSAVRGKGQSGPDRAALKKLPKSQLIAMILDQREEMRTRLEEKDKLVAELREQLAQLQGKIDKKKAEAKAAESENKHEKAAGLHAEAAKLKAEAGQFKKKDENEDPEEFEKKYHKYLETKIIEDLFRKDAKEKNFQKKSLYI